MKKRTQRGAVAEVRGIPDKYIEQRPFDHRAPSPVAEEQSQ